MTANKMPVLPDYDALIPEIPDHDVLSSYFHKSTVEAYRLTCFNAGYLAGLEAAKACVPDTDPFSGGADRDKDSQVTGQIHFRHAVLTNLTALEQEAKK